MISLSPAPSWLPSLTQPADWFVAKVLVILLVVGIFTLMAGVGSTKGGDPHG